MSKAKELSELAVSKGIVSAANQKELLEFLSELFENTKVSEPTKHTEETYTRADLVSFGNYLLSQERENMVSEINKREVTHADLENWRVQNHYNSLTQPVKK